MQLSEFHGSSMCKVCPKIPLQIISNSCRRPHQNVHMTSHSTTKRRLYRRWFSIIASVNFISFRFAVLYKVRSEMFLIICRRCHLLRR